MPTPRPSVRSRAAPLLVVTAAVGVAAGPAAGQERLPLMAVEVRPADFALSGAESIGRGRVAVVYRSDGPELALHRVHEDPVLPRVSYPEPPPTPEPVTAGEVAARHTALWVWNTRQILDEPEERARLLDLVRDESVTRVFLYLAAGRGHPPSAGFIPFDGAELGPLLAELRSRGALVYALDGDPWYALPENHPGVLRTIERLAEHNRSVPEAQRFHGVRYDIEPYLVPGWHGTRRAELLDGWMELMASASRAARRGGLAFGADIPFWLDSPDEVTGELLEATVDGRAAPILEHLLPAVDDVAVMDYRTTSLGPNGALALAHGEMEAAARHGVDVFVGLETTRLNDEDLFTFHGPSTEGLPPHGRARWIVLHGLDDGRARLWLVDGEVALAALREELPDASLLRHWPAGRPTRVAADLQSFHALGEARMRSVADDIVRRLADRPAFAGIAIHDLEGLSRLREGS
mgnify:FL=1